MTTNSDVIKCVITSISAIDFIIFMGFFIKFMIVIPFKSKELSTKIISILIIIAFIIYKAMHIPMFLSTISVINYQIPHAKILLGILTYINLFLSAVPLWLAVYTSFIQRKFKITDLSFYNKNYIKIIMPIYNEDPEALYTAIKSVINLNYNKKLLHLYLAFDDNEEPEAYKYIMKKFGLMDNDNNYTIINKYNYTIDIEGLLISICRYKHGGKKSAQKGAFKQIELDYDNLQNDFLFFIDSDIILKSDSLLQFNHHIEKHNKNCLTGMITCVASDKPNFLTFYQDIEYISGQILWRNFETMLGGASTCLPGAFTLLRYSSFKKVSDTYFKEQEYKDTIDYHRFYLGEDRYLTHLLMESEPWKIGFCEAAVCKTNSPKDLKSLLKQRRRWALGHIANDTWMMSSMELWRIYPLLSIFNFLNNSRNSSVYIYLLYFVLLIDNQVSPIIWLIFIILPILLNWIFIVIYAIKIRRKMNIIFYIIIIAIQPIFSMMYFYYSIYTIKTKSWGGIRVESKLTRVITEK